VVAKSGIVQSLSPLINTELGRPRELTLEAFFVALQLNALSQHHKAHLVAAARILNSMSPEQLAALGVNDWDRAVSYDRVERLFVKVCRVLEEGHACLDASWFANALSRAAIPRELMRSRSVAVDGTDVESWGAMKGSTHTVVLDGEARETQLGAEKEAKQEKSTRKVKTARVFGTGPDGRRLYTKDQDARAGHRSATGQRKAGTYVGYELHLSVQARDVRWTNYVDRTILADEVPNVITALSLAPAGSHRGRSITEKIIANRRGPSTRLPTSSGTRATPSASRRRLPTR
jgi:hypothetical protein